MKFVLLNWLNIIRKKEQRGRNNVVKITRRPALPAVGGCLVDDVCQGGDDGVLGCLFWDMLRTVWVVFSMSKLREAREAVAVMHCSVSQLVTVSARSG